MMTVKYYCCCLSCKNLSKASAVEVFGPNITYDSFSILMQTRLRLVKTIQLLPLLPFNYHPSHPYWQVQQILSFNPHFLQCHKTGEINLNQTYWVESFRWISEDRFLMELICKVLRPFFSALKSEIELKKLGLIYVIWYIPKPYSHKINLTNMH